MKLVLLVFRAVAATTVGITTTLAKKVSGGVRGRTGTVQTMLGSADCTTAMAFQAEASTVSGMGCLLGASGIDFDKLSLTMELTIFNFSCHIEPVEM